MFFFFFAVGTYNKPQMCNSFNLLCKFNEREQQEVIAVDPIVP